MISTIYSPLLLYSFSFIIHFKRQNIILNKSRMQNNHTAKVGITFSLYNKISPRNLFSLKVTQRKSYSHSNRQKISLEYLSLILKSSLSRIPVLRNQYKWNYIFFNIFSLQLVMATGCSKYERFGPILSSK